ncbi:MAG TPA: hypothetical protein DCR39_04980 [Nitrospiraceae bacterium]|nr:hypothetical protein [Nitrospiraceae bacterium]
MKKFLLISFAVGAMSLLPYSSAIAAEGYGAAGCGLGSMIFGNETGGIQVIAATTNATSQRQDLFHL